jgi:hypothetical protein
MPYPPPAECVAERDMHDAEAARPNDPLQGLLQSLFRDVTLFSAYASELTLRAYQKRVARAIVASVLRRQGLTFVVLFPRQSSKNELQAQIETYLLAMLSKTDAEIVKVSPTWKPQSLNAMRRLERVLSRNLITRGCWKKENGYIYRVGTARMAFLSGGPEANIVGATASTLLEVDEAQDVLISKFDKDIAPMAASTNATRVFWGTAWTSTTLLARELRAAREAEARDGLTRAFRLSADEVGAEVPAYRAFVAGQIARLGRSHPMVRTQFFSEEIDGECGMFPAARQALMRGEHLSQAQPAAGCLYALLLDVAGEDESLGAGPGTLVNPGRDATALTVVWVQPPARGPLKAPTYRVVTRRVWNGVAHTSLYAQILALTSLWQPRRLVVDATGVGAGLAGFLDQALPGRVARFNFNSASKSKLGWDFLAVVETGRWKEHFDATPEQTLFWAQLSACQMATNGPDQKIRWGVPDGTRQQGELVHDDLVLSAALAAALDELSWAIASPGHLIQASDPLDGEAGTY